jgi:putative membrane protein
MPSEAPAGLIAEGAWQRLHPLTMLFAIGARLYALRGLAVPGVVAVAVSRNRAPTGGWPSLDGWLLGPIGLLLLLFELVQYFTLAYRFDRHEIVIKRGLIWKSERHIPYARVQNIELVQNAVHRLAGVAVVRLDTGTGAGAEGELSVLSLDAVAALREAVRAGRHGEVAAGASPVTEAGTGTPAADVLVSLDLRELLLHGLLTASGWVVIAAGAGALWQFDIDGWDLVERYLPSTAGAWGQLRQATPLLILEIALLVLVAVLVFRVLSAVWSATKHYQFALTTRGDELFQSYGLLTRVGRTIPRARIQKLTVTEALLMRLFARATLTIDTAASPSEKQQNPAAGGSHVLVPIVPASSVAGLVREVYPTGTGEGPGLDDLPWQGVDPRAFGRLLRVRLVVAALIGAASYGAAHRWAVAIGLAAAAVLTAQAWVAARFTAFAWTGDTLWFRSAAATRRVTLVRAARTQVVSLERSPFDRRWGMAAVRVDTAGAASGGHDVHIRWLPAEVADALYAQLRRAAAP